MQKLKDQQDDDEIEAFRVFLAHTKLPVVSESIEKRDPPEPDILCRMENGDQLAFELVEVCHPKNAAFMGRAFSLAGLVEKTYQHLSSETRARFDERFRDTPLSFEFRPNVSRNQIGPRIRGVLSELAGQASSNDDDWVFSRDSRKILLSVRTRGRVETPGRPSFNIAGSFAPDEMVLEIVVSKLRKVYKTLHPVELIAYFGQHAWGLSREWVQPLQNALSSEGLGPFRRVWVMGWSGITYVFPG